MAFVDLKKNKLILKAVIAGPPASGKTERLKQIGREGRHEIYGTTVLGMAHMAAIPLEAEGTVRPVELEVYEWHGPERADIRAMGLFKGLDGIIYVADSREDRAVETQNVWKFLVEEAGKTRVIRLPGLLMLGRMDEGLFRLKAFEKKLQGITWSQKVETDIEDSETFIEALKLQAEAMLARVL